MYESPAYNGDGPLVDPWVSPDDPMRIIIPIACRWCGRDMDDIGPYGEESLCPNCDSPTGSFPHESDLYQERY